MRGFAATFLTGFKFLWRNPVTVFILVAFPILIILILGNALSAYLSADIELDPSPVAVAADPDGALAAFIQSDEIAPFIDPTFTDRAEAETLIKDGDVVCAIVEENGEPEVIAPRALDFDARIVLSIVDSYKKIGSAAMVAAMRGQNPAIPEITVRDMPLGKRAPSATDYYAVTMLVMILLFTGLNGSELFRKGLLSDTGSRTRLAPVSKPAVIGGLLAASTATSYLQGMVTFVFAGTVYGVYWGENIPLVMLTLLAVVLFSQSLCIFFIMLFKNGGAVNGVCQALFWVMTFVSKGYAKLTFGPADEVFQYTPNAMAHTVIFGSVYGGNEDKFAPYILILFGVGIIFFVLAFLIGRRRLA